MSRYREDYELAENYCHQSEKADLYVRLKSAVESGWDFSSRWFITDGGCNHGRYPGNERGRSFFFLFRDASSLTDVPTRRFVDRRAHALYRAGRPQQHTARERADTEHVVFANGRQSEVLQVLADLDAIPERH